MTSDFPKDRVVSISDGFRLQWEDAQHSHVLLFPEGMVKLNQSSSEILLLCDGTKSAENIVEQLQIKFPDANLENDVIALLEIAFDKGWIRVA